MTAVATASPVQAATPAAAVELRGITVRYGTLEAVKNITCAIEVGSHVTILGASGCGKSTMLGAVARRIVPSAGDVDVNGRVATIHQDLRLVKQSSALTNVLHGALGRLRWWHSLIAWPAVEKQRAVKLLERVGLKDRLHTRVGKLSGGEQQRVAIARALMQDPDILLADEPVASLDNANAYAIMHLLDSLRRERGLTLVTVLHDCHLAEAFADRIIGLQDGALVHDERAKIEKTGPQQLAGATGLRGFRRFDACQACHALGSYKPMQATVAPPTERRWHVYAAWAVVAAVVVGIYAWAAAGVGLTGRETEGLVGNAARFVGKMVPNWTQLMGMDWAGLGKSLLVTFQMTLVGTTLAVLVSLPMAALAARNVSPRFIGPLMRLVLNMIRAVPSIVWALLFVAAVGLGEMSGVLALVAYSLGYLTKFFYEAFENVDPHVPDALKEIGASGVERFAHAIWPAAKTAVVASSIFMLEYNVRAASVLGIVGAGGIGYELKTHLDYGNFHVVGTIVAVLIVVVLVLDAISGRIRRWLLRR